MSCDFVRKQLVCNLPILTMYVVLKVGTKTGKHTFRKDAHTSTLKYRMWSNPNKPFCSLNKRVSDIFCKRRFDSESSHSYHEEEEEDRGINKNWSGALPVDEEDEYKKIYRVRNSQGIPCAHHHISTAIHFHKKSQDG